MSNPIYIGPAKACFESKKVNGSEVLLDNERFYKIENSDQMRPFFMSVISDSNHWMFISSNGGLTAGRKDCDNALFPYYTDDKITESSEITGSKTLFKVHLKEKTFLWEPFSNKYNGVYNTTRNLYKNSYGNKIAFEEINHDLGLTFQYQWNSSSKFGFVRKATLINNNSLETTVSLLDGLQNIVPFGVSAEMQNSKSNLVDAYKKSELDIASGIGIYALSAIIVDKAEPSEALKATTVWSLGINSPTYLLSSLQLDKFRQGISLEQEVDIKAEKGAYFVSADIAIKPGARKEWHIVANVNQSLVSINQTKDAIVHKNNLLNSVLDDIETGTRKLKKLAGASDGFQLTKDGKRNTRHFSNTMFNIMRGGIFDKNYRIEKVDLLKFLENSNKSILENNDTNIINFPDVFTLQYLKEKISDSEDLNLKRLCFEYMPLKFSRRHGDPSRPWNKFSINTRSEIDGSKILDYEGNWRDIFQNWEALAHSYPAFIESMIFKFLNASTFDGYNPYRVTKNGFDWEVVEPNDPWSYIGYWGDHQIVYLLKFLEFIEDYFPGKLATYFEQKLFVYANVPYKIRSYEAILADPKDTIDFDSELDKQIHIDKSNIGGDGALLRSKDNTIYTVNLIEKLLTTTLAKISNFIPEAGIWLNTQRPEWNDANNALVGNGVSMVTTYYLRRFLNLLNNLLLDSSLKTVEVSEEVAVLFYKVIASFQLHIDLLEGEISDKNRKIIVDELGKAGAQFRDTIYKNGFSSKQTTISKSDLTAFCEVTLRFIDHSIDANKRPDDLYHAYNLMNLKNVKEIEISELSVMLEGQVAVLSAGYLSPKESLKLLNNLKSSALFRPDQYSYLLYPNKELSRFTEKNCISPEMVEKSALLKKLVQDGNTQILEKDVFGVCHFNGTFNNNTSLKKALSQLSKEKYQALVKQDSKIVLEIFEEIFNHKSFTGRSGTFYGYEGLGSIYWHMVSKLVLAVQETCLNAIAQQESEHVIGSLLEHYYELNEGIGVHKSPELYGAFPADPYSHTPEGKGAQQPGMTGQVKEDLLCRFGELGVFVKEGKLQFNPRLLRKDEFLKSSKAFKIFSVNGIEKELVLDKKTLCFTYCQIPVIYKLSDRNQTSVDFGNESIVVFDAWKLDRKTSRKVFSRTGEIDQIIVSIDAKEFN